MKDYLKHIIAGAIVAALVGLPAYLDSRNPYNLTWHTFIALLYYTSIRIFGRFYFNYTANNDYT